MRKSRIHIFASAYNDLDQLIRYIAHERPESASAFAQAVWKTFEQAAMFPLSSPLWRTSRGSARKMFRFRRVIGFPNMLVFYSHEPTRGIFVHHVSHSSRDLGRVTDI